MRAETHFGRPVVHGMLTAIEALSAAYRTIEDPDHHTIVRDRVPRRGRRRRGI
jgi:acyl dehydratase